jgi:hypothetical protein
MPRVCPAPRRVTQGRIHRPPAVFSVHVDFKAHLERVPNAIEERSYWELKSGVGYPELAWVALSVFFQTEMPSDSLVFRPRHLGRDPLNDAFLRLTIIWLLSQL